MKNKVRRIIRRITLIALLVIIVFSIFTYAFTYSARFATKKYNNEIEKYNTCVNRFQEVENISETKNINGFIGTFGNLDKVSECPVDILLSLIQGNSSEKIKKDIKTLEQLEEEITLEMNIAKKLVNPNDKYILKRLSSVEEIKEIQFVTNENNPDGLLHKENGGYTSCAYFSIQLINEDEIEGKDIVEKGTDAGGCVEVYKSLEDATNRCEYLSQFDNTILYSGSYALIGTMVVRTSYILTPEQQYYLTNEIFDALVS